MHILLNSGQNFLQSALETFKGHKNPSLKKKIVRNMARDECGPEFDDRLIKLVRENPAIYDVNHPHYRRTPVRMAIWDNIARELNSPSRYLQTKWKNIRYNYLQEQKCLETGIFNTNIRKRRFTADLSFLKHTAYRRDASVMETSNVKTTCNGSDNDSNSFMYPDNLATAANSTLYEVIELDKSDDEGTEYMPDVSAFLAPMKDMNEDSPQDPYAQPDMPDEPSEEAQSELSTRVTGNGDVKTQTQQKRSIPPLKKYKTDERSNSPHSPSSNRSSPLLMPMKPDTSKWGGGGDSVKNGDDKLFSNGSSSLLSEVTIRPVVPGQSSNTNKRRPSSSTPVEQLIHSTAKRRSTPTLQSSISDPIEMYCLSLVDCFRAMPRSERERVKFEFSKILKDAVYTNQS